MNARITITAAGNKPVVLRMPEAVRIESSWRMLTDTATVTLPRRALAQMFELNDPTQLRNIFPTGAAIVIELGFNMQYTTEFTGYIVNVSDELPFTISCEDAMWLLKREKVNVVTRTTYLPDFIKSITKHKVKAVAPYTLGPLRFANTTAAQVLEFIQEKFKLYSYMDNGELVVGEIYADDTLVEPVDINLDFATGNNLAYEDRENEPIKVTAVSTLSTGKKLEVTVGDTDGVEQRVAHYNITSPAELKKLAQEDLRKFNVNRYTGHCEVYGDTVVKHGFKVNLSSELYPERDGLYYCDKTVVYFDSTPLYRREVGIDELVRS